jgi:hypothetical protein
MPDMTRRVVAFLSTAVLALALAGCGDGGPQSTLLVGTWFPTGGDPNGANLPADINLVRVTFAKDGTWKVSAGCAEFGGTYDLGDDGSFSGDEKTGSAEPCGQAGADVSKILVRTDRVTSGNACHATLEVDGKLLLTMQRCESNTVLGGGLPPSE